MDVHHLFFLFFFLLPLPSLFFAPQPLTDNAITVLSRQVRLDHALQSGAETLLKIDIALYELTMSMAQQEQRWISVERLLEFIFPSGLLTYKMASVLVFCLDVGRKSSLNVGVHSQVRVGLPRVSVCGCLPASCVHSLLLSCASFYCRSSLTSVSTQEVTAVLSSVLQS